MPNGLQAWLNIWQQIHSLWFNGSGITHALDHSDESNIPESPITNSDNDDGGYQVDSDSENDSDDDEDLYDEESLDDEEGLDDEEDPDNDEEEHLENADDPG